MEVRDAILFPLTGTMLCNIIVSRIGFNRTLTMLTIFSAVLVML